MLPTIRSAPLSSLTTDELLEILSLRSEVFVVEQNCVYQDPDHWDRVAEHLCFYQHDELVAYARLLPPNTRFVEPSIGRVLTRLSSRGKGLGKMLMREAIERCRVLYDHQYIRISAQCYLQRFYEELGFSICSAAYEEDGIPHVEMQWIASAGQND